MYFREANKPIRAEFAKVRLEEMDDLGKYIFVDECSVQTHTNKKIAMFRVRRDKTYKIVSRYGLMFMYKSMLYPQSIYWNIHVHKMCYVRIKIILMLLRLSNLFPQ